MQNKNFFTKTRWLVTIILLLFLGVGNAWGVVVKDTITIVGFADNTTSGYVDTQNTGATNKGIAAKMNHWNPTSGQIKVNQGNTSNLNANNFQVYNTDAMPGNITKIELVITSTSNTFTNNYCQVTASSSSACSSNPTYNTSNAVSGSIAAGKSGTLSKSFNESSGYRYFRISFAKQGGTVKASYVIITYEYHTVTYNGNGNTSGTAPTDATKYLYNADVSTKANSGSLAKTGYTFSGWNTKADGSGTTFAVSTSNAFKITQDTTLYAKWEAAASCTTNPTVSGGSLKGSFLLSHLQLSVIVLTASSQCRILPHLIYTLYISRDFDLVNHFNKSKIFCGFPLCE